MDLSCCIWALSDPIDKTLTDLARIGFEVIDVRPHTVEGEAREHGLRVSSVAASHEMPEGAALHSADEEAISLASNYIENALEYGAGLGITAAYIVPEKEDGGGDLSRYAQTLSQLADRAAKLGMRLCIEHFPGTILPTVGATLGFLRAVGHENLYLLFDIGHAQMSKENPAAAIRAARDRLGYVHLDDNDGENDLHLGLTDGILTREVLQGTLAAIADIGYGGAVSLELKSDLDDPLAALEKSREIALEAMAGL